MAKNCTTKKVTIKKTHGRRLAKPITFTAHRGTGCGKPTRKTGHLKEYKAVFKAAAKSCSRKHKYFTKPYGKCVGDAVKQINRNMRR